MGAILFLKLVAVHYLCDYPLQGDFLAKAKNHRQPIPGVPWLQALIAHAAIQAAGVWFVTGSLPLAAIEFVGHGLIDWLKCNDSISYNMDQFLHLSFKLNFALWLSFHFHLENL